MELIAWENKYFRIPFLYWNKLFIAMLIIFLLVGIAYLIRFFRFKIGSDLPQLPQIIHNSTGLTSIDRDTLIGINFHNKLLGKGISESSGP